MAATRKGGLKTAKTLKAKYGDDYYKRIGAKGGNKGKTGGFASDKERARKAGKIGGLSHGENALTPEQKTAMKIEPGL